MTKFILIIDRIVNLYIYYICVACLLSWIPNINPNYPLFHAIFLFAGFYIIPPILGFIIGPMVIMIICALISMGLGKLHLYLTKKNQKDVLILSPEEFFTRLEQNKLKLEEENTNDTNDSESNS